MKKTFTLIFALLAGGFMLVQNANRPAHANTNGSQGGYTGSIDDGRTCGTNGGCHGGGATAQTMISTNIPVTGWEPNTAYTVTITVSSAGINKFGYEATAEDGAGNQVGLITAFGESQTIASGNGQGHVTHTNTGTSGNGNKVWTFIWTAPSAGVGDITFYTAANATNSGNNTTGDIIYNDSETVSEASGIGVEENISLLQFVAFPNPVQDQLTVTFDNPEASNMTLELIDLQGRQIKALHNGSISGAQQTHTFDVSDLDAGIYLLNLTLDGKTYTQKIIAR